MASILNRAVRNAAAMMRAAEWGDSSIPPNSSLGAFGQRGGYGASTEALAMSISTVLSCLTTLHNDVKLMAFQAMQGDPQGEHSPLPTQPQIVAEPFGPDIEPGVGFGQLAYSKAARGNAYVAVSAVDRLQYPTQVAVLHPDAVQPKRKPNGRKFFLIGGQEFGTDEIKHITGVMPPGAIAGIDPLTEQRVIFDLALKVGQYADAFFGGGGSPAGVISVNGPGDRKKAREVREAWEGTHGGVANAHRPAVMFGGATWQPMTVSPENAQFLATRRFLREEICGIFGVPLQRIQAIVENASQGGGKGMDGIDRGYVTHTLRGLGGDISIVWNRMVPGGLNSWTRFDTDIFEKASAAERAAIAQIDRVTGRRNIDEIRAIEGLPPLPNGEGQNHFVPLNSNASPVGGADNAPTPGGQQQ